MNRKIEKEKIEKETGKGREKKKEKNPPRPSREGEPPPAKPHHQAKIPPAIDRIRVPPTKPPSTESETTPPPQSGSCQYPGNLTNPGDPPYRSLLSLTAAVAQSGRIDPCAMRFPHRMAEHDREEQPETNPQTCPYCEGTRLIKKGFRRNKFEDVPLFLCRDCRKKFSPPAAKHRVLPVALRDALWFS